MTADLIAENAAASKKQQQQQDNPEQTAETTTAAASSAAAICPAEIEDIFAFLSQNNKIVFKSQQIDDPELQRNEKVQIAREIYAHNREIFLQRFGAHLQEQHLKAYRRCVIDNIWGDAPAFKHDELLEEIELMLVDFQSKLQTRKLDVKNRRYAALQELIRDGEYFSEQEMMKRSPALYQELIGQYLSENEKKQRDSYDVRNTTFSGILMHTMQQQELKDVLEQAQLSNDNAAIDDEKHEKANDLEYETEEEDADAEETVTTMPTRCADDEHDDAALVPVTFRQQWGNFENEQIACSSSCQQSIKTLPSVKAVEIIKKPQIKQTPQHFITGGERELLRQEFIGIMHEQFLDGKDVDFDYTKVDDNSSLDDLQQLNQDKEDAYFEESDEAEEDDIHITTNDDDDDGFMPRKSKNSDMESEDELDVYMKHLNKHHSL